MDKPLADKIEAFLKANLEPEHGFVLIVGETDTSHTGIISNYSGENVVEILKHFSAVAYRSSGDAKDDGPGSYKLN